MPERVVCDISGSPGAGKTTLLTDLALAVAGESGKWQGKACIGGPVAILGGERTDAGALSRDLHRTGRPAPSPGALVVPTDGSGDCPPMWRWNRKADDGAGRWDLTDWGQEITEWAASAALAMVIIDTISSAAQGSDLLDQPQQYSLGQTVRRWAREVGPQITISVSHTNQASSAAGTAMHERLDYLSRAGGNGFPGALRHLGGLTRLRKGEVPGIDPEDDRTLFAFGFSKHNESPPTDWTHHSPAIFSQRFGRVELVADGKEVAQRLDEKREAKDEQRSASRRSAQAQPRVNSYRLAKEGCNGAI
ncbi:MAG: AAA family ATPase [Halothiobacillaceae bacterium]